MARVNVPVWKQGNNDVRGREREERRIGGGEKTREIIVSNNNGNTNILRRSKTERRYSKETFILSDFRYSLIL